MLFNPSQNHILTILMPLVMVGHSLRGAHSHTSYLVQWWDTASTRCAMHYTTGPWGCPYIIPESVEYEAVTCSTTRSHLNKVNKKNCDFRKNISRYEWTENWKYKNSTRKEKTVNTVKSFNFCTELRADLAFYTTACSVATQMPGYI